MIVSGTERNESDAREQCQPRVTRFSPDIFIDKPQSGHSHKEEKQVRDRVEEIGNPEEGPVVREIVI